jgi:hypothetical protein
MTLAFWANKHSLVGPSDNFHWNQKIYVTFFTMVHIYYGISSPLHL